MQKLGLLISIVYFYGSIFSMTEAVGLDLKDVQSFPVLEKSSAILRSTEAFGEIVAFNFVASGGVVLSPQPGALELLAKTVGNGTKSYSKEEIDRIFTESGAIFSFEPRMDYIEVSLKCLKKFLPKLLPVIVEMLTSPLLTEKEIKLSKAQMIADLKNEKDHPDAVLQLSSYKAFYAGHPYYHRPSGYLETVPEIKRNDLTALVPKIFNRENIFFSLVGNFKKDEAAGIIETYFKALPHGTKALPTKEVPKNHTDKVVFDKFDSPTTYFMAKFKAPSLMEEDYPALVIASQILDNRLFEEVRTKRGLTYAVSASIGNSGINSGALYVSSTQLKEAVKVIFDEVKKIQTELIDDTTLELQVRKFTSNWYMGREQASSQARIFSLYQSIGNGWQNSNSFIERLHRVKPEQVRAVSQKYLKNYTLTVVGPEKVDVAALVH